MTRIAQRWPLLTLEHSMLLFSLNNLNETGNSAEPTQRSSLQVHFNAAKLLYLSLKPN